jgi:transcriptional regulator with XRE-family HTH domain
MSTRIGLFLRELRTARQLSLSRLAAQSGVAKSTLSKWEAGAFEPRLPELEAVLATLGASPAQREQALSVIGAPRAVRQIRRETLADPSVAPHLSPLGDESLAPPAGGDLLRAMRHRSHLSLCQVADELGVRQSTVVRWERSETMPPRERLGALFDLLNARPEERAALAAGVWALAAADDTAPSVDDFVQRLAALEERVRRGDRALMELCFLGWEAQLWPLARHASAAWELLGRGYARYSQWLTWDGRLAEGYRYANWALAMHEPATGPEADWLVPVHVRALVAAHGRGPGAAARAVERLREWLPLARQWSTRCVLQHDMATYAAASGETEVALTFSGRAREAAARSESEPAVRLSRFVHAEVLRAAAQPQAALLFLPHDTPLMPVRRVIEANAWAATLLALGDRSAAAAWLARAFAVLEEYGFAYFRASVESVARSL